MVVAIIRYSLNRSWGTLSSARHSEPSVEGDDNGVNSQHVLEHGRGVCWRRRLVDACDEDFKHIAAHP